MSVRYQPNKGILEVFFTCDVCSKKLDGYDVHLMPSTSGTPQKEGEVGEVYFACHNTKGDRCHDKLEAKLKEVTSAHTIAWHHLYNVPIYLAFNANIISEKQAEAMQKMAAKHKESKPK